MPTKTIKKITIFAISAWFVFAFIAGMFGYFIQENEPPTHLALFFLTPMIGFISAAIFSKSFKAYIYNIPLYLLVGAHVWRFVGIGFVLGWIFGYLPAGFSIPEGFGDIIAAAGAIPLAIAIYKGKRVRRMLVLWNAFGLIDLISAITMGILYSVGPLGILAHGGPTTKPMITFPINLIPTFFVPFFILIHLLIFRRRLEVGSEKNE